MTPETIKSKARKTLHSEKSLHSVVATYLKVAHPKVIFRTDFAAGIKMSIPQALLHKKLQSGRAYPDIFIAEPRNGYCGLYLELKRSRDEVYCMDGSYRKSEHIQEQLVMLGQLRQRGYKAEFVCGIDEAIKIIDEYLNS